MTDKKFNKIISKLRDVFIQACDEFGLESEVWSDGTTDSWEAAAGSWVAGGIGGSVQEHVDEYREMIREYLQDIIDNPLHKEGD